MRRFFDLTLKMSLASIVSIFIASALGLEYAITGGILAVLSIQLTRKDSIISAVQRFLSSLIALALATMLFLIFGYTLWVFALFTAVFIAISFASKLSIGIVSSLVLVSHLLQTGSFSGAMLLNSVLLITIAIGVALALNSFYPLKSEKTLLGLMNTIDEIIIQDLRILAKKLAKSDTPSLFEQHNEYKATLKTTLKEARLLDKDILLSNDHRFINYLNVRNTQMKQIDRIFKLTEQHNLEHSHAQQLANYVENLSQDVGHADKASTQLESLSALLEDFRKKALPKTREEFETRAILYQITLELETFLKEKIVFHETYPIFK